MEVHNDSVLLKLLYYCSTKKEVYFRRSDVTDFIVADGAFTIPNKQGFDGNLSYFGYDIESDTDGRRILLLRGKTLANACLNGQVSINVDSESSEVTVSHDDENFATEFRSLTKNKTREASIFRKLRDHADSMNLTVCSFRLYGNKRIFEKDGAYFIYPRVLVEPSTDTIQYELAVVPQLAKYEAQIVFPLFNEDFEIYSESIHSWEEIRHQSAASGNVPDFVYFSLGPSGIEPVDIQRDTTADIVQLISTASYDFSDKTTTRQVLSSQRVNADVLRTLVLSRDGNKCQLCDINDDRLLICSHIKPWSTGEDRLDMNNALTLCRMHDGLFDKGFISFDQTGNMLASSEAVLGAEALKTFLKSSITSIEVRAEMREYLDYHRNQIFLA
jgi:hypothetical protein